MINPILRVVKENDVVLLEIPATIRFNQPAIRQIVKIRNLKYEPEDEKHPNTNWLHFDGEVLLTTERVPKGKENVLFANGFGIKEVLNEFLIEKYKKDFMMFHPSENQYTEEEYQYLQRQWENNI